MPLASISLQNFSAGRIVQTIESLPSRSIYHASLLFIVAIKESVFVFVSVRFLISKRRNYTSLFAYCRAGDKLRTASVPSAVALLFFRLQARHANVNKWIIMLRLITRTQTARQYESSSARRKRIFEERTCRMRVMNCLPWEKYGEINLQKLVSEK